jgi:ATP-grasp domain/L-amino acid ligase C-terminal domain 2/ATP-grasp N-terminal domain
MTKRVILVASKTGYQVREFYAAAERAGVDLVLATDRCHVLDDPWADRATPIDFAAPSAGIDALKARGPFEAILAVGDQPAEVAALAAESLGLRFHRPEAARAAHDKFLTRERFRAAGLNVPEYSLLDPGVPLPEKRYPCVVKPLHLSASRGVIRADSASGLAAACARIRRFLGDVPLLAEDFIPGREFALEGLVTRGKLQTLALFDKPDPLNGPFFEESIYTTPSREPASVQQAIITAVGRAVAALGFTDGPVHAEMRVNCGPERKTAPDAGDVSVWMLEAAARPIGGLCARVLRFALPEAGLRPEIGLEDLLLRHALGQDVSAARLAAGGHGVMMIPVPRAGVYTGVEGLERARETADIESVEITAKEGQYLEPLPEGDSYLGFAFARAASAEAVETALRRANASLRFQIVRALPVVR